MCTLYKGVPHGLAHIEFKHPVEVDESFEGIGIFTNGQLHAGPFNCISGDGIPKSFSLMNNGRPAENYCGTYYF